MKNAQYRLVRALVPISLALCLSGMSQAAPPIRPEAQTAPVKVACVGDSITKGFGTGSGNSWPEQLGRMLGKDWEVRNFGVSGTTLMNSGDKPYQKQAAFGNAKAFNPDVVVIMLGTNDTKPDNWKKFQADFEADLTDMAKQFLALSGKPRIFLCHPPYIPGGGNWGINEPSTLEEIPVIARVAKTMKLGLVDVHGSLKGKDRMIPDKVHPNAEGAGVIAGAVFKALTGKDAPVVQSSAK